MWNKRPGGRRRGCGLPVTRPRQQTNDGFWRHARFAQSPQSRVAVTLGESPAIWADHQWHMSELRWRQPKLAVDEQLPRRRRNEIIAAHDMRDSVGSVVDHDRELIGRRATRLPDNEVATMMAKVNMSGAAKEIDETRRIGHTKPPGERRIQPGSVSHPAIRTGTRVYQLGAVCMGSASCRFDVATCASARVDKLGLLQPCERLGIQRHSLSLDQRAFVPIQTEPLKIGDGLVGRPGLYTWRVDVFNAQDNTATGRPGHKPGDQIGAGIS